MYMPFDIEIVTFFANHSTSSLTSLFQAVSFFGSLFFVFILILVFWIIKRKRFALVFLTALLSTEILVYLLKILTNRARPFMNKMNSLMYTPSFPSAHTANIFLFTVLLTLYDRRYWFTILVAPIVAFSRIYIGAHFLSDVLAGAAVGVILAFIFYKNRDKIVELIKEKFSLKKF